MFQTGNNPGMHLATQLIGNYSVHRSKRITQILGHALLAAVEDKYGTSFFLRISLNEAILKGFPRQPCKIYILLSTKCILQNVNYKM